MILLDPGHGGVDPGAVGTYKGAQVLEKNLSLEFAKLLKEKLENKNLKTLMTRVSDTSVSLVDRLRLSKELRPDFLFSIHFNSAPKTASGFEILLRTNSHPYSINFAKLLRKEIANVFDIPDRGIKEGRWYILVYQPSALLEVCFINNEKDLEHYFSRREDLLEAIVYSFLKFFKKK